MTNYNVMGIDLGTQGIKVIVYNPDQKQVIASSYETYPLHSGENGSREQNAEDWLAAFHSCLDSITPDIRACVKAIGVSGQQHGFVPVSKGGEVLAPVKLWCDTSTEIECNEIMDCVGGADACLEMAGNTIAVGYTASKILWLKKNHPQAYSRMDTILLPHDYLNFYMTGERVMEHGDASGTGLLSIKERQWCTPLLHAIDKERDLSQCLPRLISAHESAGTIKPEFALRTGLPQDAIISAGGGDNMMAAVGTGNVREGRLTASLGTSGTLFGYSDSPIVDTAGHLAGFCSSTGGWLPLLCTMNCTVATEQARALIGVEVDDIEALAAAIPAGSEGVLTLPFYNGERTPNLPDGKAVIYGLDTTNTTKGHLLRSAMEAAIFGLKTGLEAFSQNGMQFDHVILTGGGSNSRLWRQITADILGLTVRVLAQKENAAFGGVLQAMWCLAKQIDDTTLLQDIVDSHLADLPEKNCEPNPDNTHKYNKVYKDYQQLVDALTPIFKK